MSAEILFNEMEHMLKIYSKINNFLNKVYTPNNYHKNYKINNKLSRNDYIR